MEDPAAVGNGKSEVGGRRAAHWPDYPDFDVPDISDQYSEVKSSTMTFEVEFFSSKVGEPVTCVLFTYFFFVPTVFL